MIWVTGFHSLLILGSILSLTTLEWDIVILGGWTLWPANTTSKFFQLFGVIAQCVRTNFCYHRCVLRIWGTCLFVLDVSKEEYLIWCVGWRLQPYFHRGTCLSFHTNLGLCILLLNRLYIFSFHRECVVDGYLVEK